MQTEADTKHNKNKGDEDGIHFRPSPNFKHMKKYLKYKFEEAASSAEEEAFSSALEEEHRLYKLSRELVQPPLPPNPPPPDSPLQITLKKEIEDDGYQTNSLSQTESEPEPQPEVKPEYKPAMAEASADKTMCRQFARGACTRGAACIFAHEVILSQLPGIYTFCKNFQNNGCILPKCKFVHATVFEKEYYYRTGYLPPHSLAHLEKNAQGPAAAPPALEAAPAEPAPAPLFPNPPPPLALGAPAAGAGTPAAKRDWRDGEDFGGSRNPDNTEPAQKKCKTCYGSSLRLQFYENKVEKLRRSTQEQQDNIVQLTSKTNKLYSLIYSLMNLPPTASKSGQNGILLNSLTGRTESDKAMNEKLKAIFGGSTRSPVVEDDPSKALSTVLVRLLLNTGSGGDS